LLDSLPIQAWALLSGGLPVDSYFAIFLILAHNDWVGSHLPLKILTAVTVGNSTRSHFLTGVFPPTRDKALFAFWRQSIDRDQSIFCINNLSDRPQNLILSELNLTDTEAWYDLISKQIIENIYSKITLNPYQCLWLTNKF
jgi:hypothetical protein